jgi:hypothetical protein
MGSSARLLRLAAEALERGEQPFNDEFLAVNEVTLDQCMALARQLAIGARVVAEAFDKPRSEAGLAVFNQMAQSP